MAEPYCLAMVLCDAVHRDLSTGKFTILGTFTTLGAAKYPAVVMGAVYFAVTDGLGEVDLRIRIVESQADLTDADGTLIFESQSNKVRFGSPLEVLEGAFLLSKVGEDGMAAPVMLPHEGMYHCELTANGVLLMSRRLLALGPEGPTP